MKRIIHAVAELLYPTRCRVCGHSGYWLCPKCVTKLPKPHHQNCVRCNRPALGGTTHPKCQTRNTPAGVAGVFAYEGEIKKVIGRFKYEGRTCYAADLAEAMLWGVKSSTDDLVGLQNFLGRSGRLWLVPVPLYKRKLRQRGYNQAELLARELAARLAGKLVTELVVKVQDTKDQAELTQKERKKNLKGVFKLNKKYQDSKTEGVRILLVDDVTTTGSTLLEVGRLIKRHLRVEVWGVALAR